MSIIQILESQDQGTKKKVGCGLQGGEQVMMGPDVLSLTEDMTRDVR